MCHVGHRLFVSGTYLNTQKSSSVIMLFTNLEPLSQISRFYWYVLTRDTLCHRRTLEGHILIFVHIFQMFQSFIKISLTIVFEISDNCDSKWIFSGRSVFKSSFTHVKLLSMTLVDDCPVRLCRLPLLGFPKRHCITGTLADPTKHFLLKLS